MNIDAAWFNRMQAETVAVIQGSGLALDEAHEKALVDAIRRLVLTVIVELLAGVSDRAHQNALQALGISEDQAFGPHFIARLRSLWGETGMPSPLAPETACPANEEGHQPQ